MLLLSVGDVSFHYVESREVVYGIQPCVTHYTVGLSLPDLLLHSSSDSSHLVVCVEISRHE